MLHYSTMMLICIIITNLPTPVIDSVSLMTIQGHLVFFHSIHYEIDGYFLFVAFCDCGDLLCVIDSVRNTLPF